MFTSKVRAPTFSIFQNASLQAAQSRVWQYHFLPENFEYLVNAALADTSNPLAYFINKAGFKNLGLYAVDFETQPYVPTGVWRTAAKITDHCDWWHEAWKQWRGVDNWSAADKFFGVEDSTFALYVGFFLYLVFRMSPATNSHFVINLPTNIVDSYNFHYHTRVFTQRAEMGWEAYNNNYQPESESGMVAFTDATGSLLQDGLDILAERINLVRNKWGRRLENLAIIYPLNASSAGQPSTNPPELNYRLFERTANMTSGFYDELLQAFKLPYMTPSFGQPTGPGQIITDVVNPFLPKGPDFSWLLALLLLSQAE